MGHFGRRPIQTAWLGLVLPGLALNYLGQGALLLADPEKLENPFFLLYPDWALLPMVVLATVATIIASQAVITGAFSLTQQAIQLGLLPRIGDPPDLRDREGPDLHPAGELAAARCGRVPGRRCSESRARSPPPTASPSPARWSSRPSWPSSSLWKCWHWPLGGCRLRDRAVPRSSTSSSCAPTCSRSRGRLDAAARRRRAAGRDADLAARHAHPGREGPQGGRAACSNSSPCWRRARPHR